MIPGSGINKSNIVNFESFNEIHGSFKNETNLSFKNVWTSFQKYLYEREIA